MNKKEYEAKRAQLLAEMKAAIDAGDAVKASAAEKEVMELDEKFQALAKAQANFAALNGSRVPAAPAVPAALNTAPIAPVSNAKAEEDKLYTQAFAHYMMGVKMSAEEQNIFDARNATSTVKENHVVVPTTLKQGIWNEMEELHPIIADLAGTNIPGDVDILLESTAGNDGAWYDEDAVTAEKVVNTKITLKGCELAKAIEVSWKLKKMAVDEFLSYVAKRIADKMANALAAGLVTGAGVGNGTTDKPKPLGVITKLEAENGTPQVATYTVANNVGIKYTDMTKMRAKIKSGYAAGAAFYAKSDTIWNQLANIVDGNGRPIFIPDATQGGVGRIFGILVKEEDAIPADAVLLGNMAKGYAFNVNEDITMYQEDHVLVRTTDYMGYALVDGQPLTTKAFAYLKKTS